MGQFVTHYPTVVGQFECPERQAAAATAWISNCPTPRGGILRQDRIDLLECLEGVRALGALLTAKDVEIFHHLISNRPA